MSRTSAVTTSRREPRDTREDRDRRLLALGPGVRAGLAVPALVLALLATMAVGSWLEGPAAAIPTAPAPLGTGSPAIAGPVARASAPAPQAADAVPRAGALERLADLLRDDDAPRLAAFPIVGPVRLTRSFGDARSGGRRHQGVDILAGKLLPVVAVADGTVAWVRENPRGGTIVVVRHADGWESRYMHLNDDRPGSDDGRGFGVAPGVVTGAEVHAGDVIGWVGDSGNAEDTTPHLHFELHRADGTAVDPWPVLRDALAARPSGIALTAAID